MAPPQRKPDPAVVRQLREEGSRFGFFQAVQTISDLSPGAAPLGELGPPKSEPIRFRHDPSLTFSASDIARVEWDPTDSTDPRAEMTTTFLGLTGAVSPLSLAMCEDVISDARDDEGALAAFYDVFHHRLLSLFYRSWKKYRFSSDTGSSDASALLARCLSFVGVDAAGALPRGAVPRVVRLALAPLLSQRSRSARTLEIALERLLPPEVTASVECFVEREVTIAGDQRVSLGRANTTLGVDVTIGASILDRSGRFRLRLGPVSYDDYERMMPGGALYPVLRSVIGEFSRGIAEAELEISLAPGDTPRFALGDERGAILGRTTQLQLDRQRPMRVRVLLADDSVASEPRVVPDDEA